MFSKTEVKIDPMSHDNEVLCEYPTPRIMETNCMIHTVEQELEAYYPEYKVKEQALKNKTLQDLLNYQEELILQLKALDREQYEKKNPGFFTSLWNKIKKPFYWLRDKIITAADLGGTTGFVAHIILTVAKAIEAVGVGLKYFLSEVASPLALAAITAHILLETKHLYENENIKQRKTRYTANFVQLALLGFAMTLAVGAVVLAPYALPAIFAGLIVTQFIKDAYILKITHEQIDQEKEKIKEKEAELNLAIIELLQNQVDKTELNQDNKDPQLAHKNRKFEIKNSYAKIVETENNILKSNEIDIQNGIVMNENLIQLRMNLYNKISEDPRIRRLTHEINEHNNRLQDLKLTAKYTKRFQIGRGFMLFAIGLLITGMLAFPPISIVGASIILVTVVVNTANRYLQHSEKEHIEATRQNRKPNQTTNAEIHRAFCRGLTPKQQISNSHAPVTKQLAEASGKSALNQAERPLAEEKQANTVVSPNTTKKVQSKNYSQANNYGDSETDTLLVSSQRRPS